MSNPANNQIQEIAIFDLDGTLTHQDTYLAFLLHTLKKHPLRIFRCWHLPFVVLIFKLKLKKNNWLKEQFLTAIAAKLPFEKLHELVTSFIHDLEKRGVRSRGIEEINRKKCGNSIIILATASFDFYVEPLAKSLGIEHVICSLSQRNTNKSLTGKLEGNNCYGDEKLVRLKAYCAENNIEGHTTMYSDHHTDIPVLDWSDNAVMVNPTDTLKNLGLKKGYQLVDWQ